MQSNYFIALNLKCCIMYLIEYIFKFKVTTAAELFVDQISS